MIFPSYIFIFIFLPLVLIIWLSPIPLKIRLIVLTLASYIFYAWWDYRFVSLLIISTLIDFYCGAAIYSSHDKRTKKNYLIVSIASNLTILGFFKYFDFFIRSGADLLSSLGFTTDPILLNLILPLGISFYTFQSMSYSLDIYRGDAKPAPSFYSFAAYVSLFPQLIAGPIVRYQLMAHQLYEMRTKRTSLIEFTNGVWFFVLGLSKKLLIADRVAPLADRIFDGSGPVQMGAAWAGSLAYTIQLYFNFSAYSDMAIGLGLMLGFRFPINFLSPYKSKSISEFWNRWHITLSHFLRDYLFIPLGGSREGVTKTMRNLIIVMFLGGLWHGAQWTFVVWGSYHGLLLAIHAIYSRVVKVKIPTFLGVFITFLSVHFGWVIFRSTSFDRVFEIYKGLLGFSGAENLLELGIQSQTFGNLPNFIDIFGGPKIFIFLLSGLFILFTMKNTHELRRSFNLRWSLVIGMLFVICIGTLGKETPFIYFQF